MASSDPLAPDFVQATPTNPKALVGFAFSIAGLVLLYPPLTVLGLVFGFMAGNEIDRHSDMSGYNFMLGAKAFGVIGIVVEAVVYLYGMTQHIRAPGL